MGHRWGSHGGTWNMGTWGQNIAFEMLHFWWGYVLGARAARTSKHMLNYMPKREMFHWVVGFEVQVLRLMCCGVQFLTNQNECQATTETKHVGLLRGPRCQCVETHVGPPQSEQCI